MDFDFDRRSSMAILSYALIHSFLLCNHVMSVTVLEPVMMAQALSTHPVMHAQGCWAWRFYGK